MVCSFGRPVNFFCNTLLFVCAITAVSLSTRAQECPPLPSANRPGFSVPQPAITQIDANTIKVRLDMPPVNRQCTSLPQVKFQPFDTVTVNAGGCVQTGGKGKTWKRYVDPSGDNADRLYHGLISIPTETTGLERIQSVMRRSPLTVKDVPPGTDPSTMVLKLGYEDDNYKDNGYWRPDDGTRNQCKNVGNAFIELTITHHAQAFNPPISALPMDLTWNEVDNNLLPLNPVWAFRKNHPANQLPDAGALCNHFHDEGDVLKLGNPPCTSQSPSVDEPGTSFTEPDPYYFSCHFEHSPSGTVAGHVDWGLVTYTGSLSFWDWSGNFPQDDDLNFTLVRDDEAGAVTGNPRTVRLLNSLFLEFNRRETIENFKTTFWSSFNKAVDVGNAESVISSKPAVVVGLMGIDNEHEDSIQAEIHPVLGMAVRVSQTPSEEVWAFFARSSGNEGACSQDRHSFPGDSMSFFLQTSYQNAGHSEFSGTGAGSFGVKAVNGGIILQVDIPQQGGVDRAAWGELHLQRTAAQRKTANEDLRPASLQRSVGTPQPAIRQRRTESGEDSAERLLDQLTPAQRQTFMTRFKQLDQEPSLPVVPMTRNDSKVIVRQRVLAAGEPRILVRSKAEVDPRLRQHLANIHQALVQAVGSESAARELYKKMTPNNTGVLK